MKRIIILMGALFPFIGKSQIPSNINLNNGTCGYYSNSTINLSGTNTFVIGSSNYNFKSAAAVHIPPETHISAGSPSVTGKFNASIANNQLDAVILAPANPNAVPKFAKVELGINLSTISSVASIDSRITTFLTNTTGIYKPGTSGYATAFNNGTIINPYDPQQISVDVVLFRPGSPNLNGVVRFGFYYKGATLNGSQTDWQYNSSPYEWRARFAPDELGTWTGYVNIYIGGKLVQENKSFSFTVVVSANPGFVQKGPNPRYLQYSGTGDTYIPYGNAFAWTVGQENGCVTSYCNNAYDHRIKPNALAELTTFVNRLTNQPAGNGGNTTRLLMAPWFLQIEFEKLGNYDSRQVEMSVLDQYIDLLEQRNVKLILGQLVVDIDSVKNQDPEHYTEGWSGNPYNGDISGRPAYPNYQFKGIQGISVREDLFNPAASGYATALQFFKNRWRYIESRWGYSTAISTYELLTEVSSNNGWLTQTDANFANWCNTISQYLKEGVGSKHLTTVSYGGGDASNSNSNPFVILPAYNQSHVWSKPYIDVLSAHQYYDIEHGLRKGVVAEMDAKNAYPTKPAVHNESDAGFFDQIDLCTDIAIHNQTWGSMFSGAMGPNMQWQQGRFMLNPPNYGATNSYAGEYEKNYAAFQTFISPIDFKNTTYSSYLALLPASTPFYEVFHMVDNAKGKAYGWVHNRSFNHFTDIDCFNNKSQYNTMSDFRNDVTVTPSHPLYFKRLAPQTLETPPDSGYNYNYDNYVTVFGSGFAPVGVPSTSNVLISGLLPNEPYAIMWYWTWGTNGGQVASAYTGTNLISNGAGTLAVTAPPTGTVSGTLYPGDWAFKIIQMGFMPTGTTGREEPQQSKIRVSPNPSSNVFVLSTAGDLSLKATIRLFDVSGRLIHEEAVKDVNGYQLNLSNNDNGVYILKVKYDDGQETILKLVKNK